MATQGNQERQDKNPEVVGKENTQKRSLFEKAPYDSKHLLIVAKNCKGVD